MEQAPPAGYERIKYVKTLEDLLASKFNEKSDVNAFCYERRLTNDFTHFAEQFAVGVPAEQYHVLDQTDFINRVAGLGGLDAYRSQIDIITQDLEAIPGSALRVYGPSSSCDGPHVDRLSARVLCSYNIATLGYRNKDVAKNVLYMRTDRRKITEGAKAFSLGEGNIWKIAGTWDPVDAFVHEIPAPRLPETEVPPRLVLIHQAFSL